MKRIFSTALAIVLFAAASQAQTGDEAKGPHGGQRGKMLKELNLTAEQKAQLKNIHQAEKKEMDALKNNGKTDADQASRKAIHDKYRSQMDALLTTEQKAKWQNGRKEARDERKEGFGNREKAGRMAGLQKDLNLTPEQQTKVDGINSDFRTKMQSLRGNTALSDADKKAQLRQLAEEHRAQMKAVLTPEQISKMKEKHKGRKGNPNATL